MEAGYAAWRPRDRPPELGSQSKEALTTPADAFGGACVVSDSFVKAVAALPGLTGLIVDREGARTAVQLDRKVRNRHVTTM